MCRNGLNTTFELLELPDDVEEVSFLTEEKEVFELLLLLDKLEEDVLRGFVDPNPGKVTE